MKEIEHPCGLSDEELKEEVDRIKSEVSRELRKMQKKYDHETEHGLLSQVQDKWNEYLDEKINL